MVLKRKAEKTIPEAGEAEKTPVEEIPAEALPEENYKQIPNVLPEPKKHVKREAVDFTQDISEELMHFDVEITSDDDFDLK